MRSHRAYEDKKGSHLCVLDVKRKKSNSVKVNLFKCVTHLLWFLLGSKALTISSARNVKKIKYQNFKQAE